MKLQSCGLTVLRVVVGIVFLMHGYQKLFHMHIHGVAGFFGHLGIPLPLVAARCVEEDPTCVTLTPGERRSAG